MKKFIDKLEKLNFEPVKQVRDYTVFKSPQGVAIVFNDGNVEGFVKNAKNVPLNESFSVKHAIESIILIGLSITYFTTDLTVVNGISMEPTYKNYSIIIRSKSSRDVKHILIKHGTTIRLNSPTGEQCFKRVVAVPGDELTFQGAIVYVNGVQIDQSNKNHLGKQQRSSLDQHISKKDAMNKIDSLTLKNNEYYVMGDNREASVDSRDYGPINHSCIIAVVDK
jgi:signal peptidase I